MNRSARTGLKLNFLLILCVHEGVFQDALGVEKSFYALRLAWHSRIRSSEVIHRFASFTLISCQLECWICSSCKAVNFDRMSHLCELLEIDATDVTMTSSSSRHVISEKKNWNQANIEQMCSREDAYKNNCIMDSVNRIYCPNPVTSGNEFVLGNMRLVGSKIQYGCDIDGYRMMTGKAECLPGGSWSDTWRPCKGPTGNHVNDRERTWQSTIHADNVADRAVDGNTDGDLYHDSCMHTEESRGFWAIEFNDIVIVKKVVIYNRVDCCLERLQDIHIMVSVALGNIDDSGNECATYAGPPQDLTTDNPINVICGVPKAGKFLKIKTGAGVPLTMCEVEVFSNI